MELRHPASPRGRRLLVDESDLGRENVGLVCRIVGELRVGANAQELAEWEKYGEQATAQMEKDGIVGAQVSAQLNSYLAAARAGKKQ